VGQLPDEITDALFLGGEGRLLTQDASGENRVWTLDSAAPARSRVLGTVTGQMRPVASDGAGRRVAAGDAATSVRLWDLEDPLDAEPLTLNRPESPRCFNLAFDAGGRWLVTDNCGTVAFWPLGGRWRRSLKGHQGLSYWTAFSPDGRWLATCRPGAPVRLWPLDPADGTVRPLLPENPCFGLVFHPEGTHLLEGLIGGGAVLYSLRGGPPRTLTTGWEGALGNGTCGLAFDASGRRVALAPFDMSPALSDPSLYVLRTWDLDTDVSRTFSVASLITREPWWGFGDIRFAPDGRLYTAGQDAVRRLTLPKDETGAVSAETLHTVGSSFIDLSEDGRTLLVWSSANRAFGGSFDEVRVFDLEADDSHRIISHGQPRAADLDASGRILVTGDEEGVVRVGPVTGEEPHLLLGHTGPIESLAISADGRWIASVSDDALHLWPVPDLSQPPLHTLPYEELMEKLDALTNLRVVRDPSSPTGWSEEIGPFPGWKEVPTW
jgi:WD40 repeat protein